MAIYSSRDQDVGLMMAKTAKGVLVDGKKLRGLRKKEGKTQKGLIAGTTIQLRTYQRAEQGQHILPDLAEQIAKLLKTDLKTIRADQVKDDAPTNSYRLHNVATVGALKFFETLQGGYGTARYEFAINPRPPIAEQVADFIEFCRPLEIPDYDLSERRDPATAIRFIGELNHRADVLAAQNIYVFFGTYTQFDIEKDVGHAIPIEVTGEQQIVPYTISSYRNLRVIFSEENAPFLSKRFSSWFTYESAVERVINANVKLSIQPDWLPDRSFIFDAEFVAQYRRAYEDAFGKRSMLTIVKSES